MAVTATISAQVQNMITARFELAGDMGGQPSSGAGMIRQGGLGLKAPDLNVDGMLFGTFVAVGSAVREIHLVDPAPFGPGGTSVPLYDYQTTGKVLRALRIRNADPTPGNYVDMQLPQTNGLTQWGWTPGGIVIRLNPTAEIDIPDGSQNTPLDNTNSWLAFACANSGQTSPLECTFLFGPSV